MSGGIWDTCVVLWDLKRSECASWAQAWGTFLAIGGSVYVVNRAHKLQSDRQDRQAEKDYDRFLLNLAHVVREVQGHANTLAEEERSRRIHFDAMDVAARAPWLVKVGARLHAALSGASSLSAALAKMELNRVDREDVMQAFLESDHYARTILRLLQRSESQMFKWETDARELLPVAAEYAVILKGHVQVLKAALNSRGVAFTE